MRRSLEKESALSADKLRELLSYNPVDGYFTWIRRPQTTRANKIFNGHHAGKIAGVSCPRGYIYIRIRGLGMYSAARLVWLCVHGRWPNEEMDHINGNPSDNSIANLREATRAENGANRSVHSNNKSGFKGVSRAGGKWAADVRMNGKRYRLGRFETRELAAAAYAEKAKEIQKEFARL